MNRKEFIKNSLGAIALAAVAPSAFGKINSSFSSLAKPQIKLALKFSMVEIPGMSILDKFRMLKDIGFDGVEFDSPNTFDNKEIVSARDKTGLVIPSVICSKHWSSPLSSPDPKVRAECVEAMKVALSDCREYGGTSVLLVPGVVNQDVNYEDAYKRSQEEIRKLLPAAKETGVKIAIENVWNNFLLSPMEAARYIDEFNDPMIGWHFDIGNIVRYGWPEQWIRILNKRILKLDVKEFSRKKEREEGVWKGFDAELTEGDNNWPEVLKALEEIGYNGWASAEVDGGDRKRMEHVYSGMCKIFK
jgi:L-ribulose-5-phosphate 3-epimerase